MANLTYSLWAKEIVDAVAVAIDWPHVITPLARNADPPTSKEAARSMREFASHHATLIIGALRRPATATEIAEYSGLDAVQVCRRLTELERLGVIRPTGATRKTASGRQSREWERVKV